MGEETDGQIRKRSMGLTVKFWKKERQQGSIEKGENEIRKN